jgi:hypothetical protein
VLKGVVITGASARSRISSFLQGALARIDLALAVAMTLSAWTGLAEAGDQNCIPDRNGGLVCPQADSSCLREQDRGVVCSKPGGGI